MSSDPGNPANAQATVLVVDDERRNRDLVRHCLETEYRVLEAEDAASTFEVLARERVDIVLLDVMMPGTNGFDACRRIKAAYANEPFLPVLLITALNEQNERNKGLEAGADDFLSKPVDRHELRLRVRSFVKLRQQERMIRDQYDQLQNVSALKDDLVSLLVHDMRNPLAGVFGMLGVLREGVSDPQQREDLDLTLDAAKKLRDTIEDVLEVRSLESGVLALNVERVSVRRLVHDAASTVEGTARSHGVVVVNVGDSDCVLPADRRLVRRAVENLITNAITFSPRPGQVEVSVRVAERSAEINVADRGPGIPDQLKDRLFQKFGGLGPRSDTGRRGYGLGLYLVRLVGSAHGGEVRVRDRSGGGTVFSLNLTGAA